MPNPKARARTAFSRHPGSPAALRRLAILSAIGAAVAAAGPCWGLWSSGAGIGCGPGDLQGNRDLAASWQLLFCPWIAWGLMAERGAWRAAAWSAWAGFAYAMAIAQCRAAWLGFAMMAAAGLVLAWRSFSYAAALEKAPRLAWPALVLMGAFAIHGLIRPAADGRESGREIAAAGEGPEGRRSLLSRSACGGPIMLRRPHLASGKAYHMIAQGFRTARIREGRRRWLGI